MATIRNKTRKPLKVPLPGGKFLRLAPAKDGEVNAKAVDHPPLVKMIEAGDIEVVRQGKSGSGKGGSSHGLSGVTGHDPDKTIRKTGDG